MTNGGFLLFDWEQTQKNGPDIPQELLNSSTRIEIDSITKKSLDSSEKSWGKREHSLILGIYRIVHETLIKFDFTIFIHSKN
jgi:hypothetical protein